MRFSCNGDVVDVPPGGTLLDALRDELGRLEVKDGCAPQGQCGCCTVLVDGQPRVSCVTPLARVAGREVTTLEGLDPDVRSALVAAFDATAASQCGFCTPGILVRLAALPRRGAVDGRAVRSALSAHLCRCTGFQPIVEAALVALAGAPSPPPRDPNAASARASLEAATGQRAGAAVIEGRGGFADDTAPRDALVALGTAERGYEVASSWADARRRAGARQGRNSTVALRHPVPVPSGRFELVLQTTWVEPAYLEPDASWCAPGAEAASPSANGGDFGAKASSSVAADAAALAAEHGRTVKARYTREAVVRRGAKRPPLALGLRADGTGVLELAWTEGSEDLAGLVATLQGVAPGVEVRLRRVAGPRVSAAHRGAGLAELLAARALLTADGPRCRVEALGASAQVGVLDGALEASVDAGRPLCAATLRSYVLGAVHQGFSMVTTEGIAVTDDGRPVDLTIRSFGITPARALPHVEVAIAASGEPPVPAGTAVLAATLAAVWLAEGAGPTWPTRR